MAAEFDEQERARLLKQYSEIATLAGGLAHEIRNPLSTIRLNLNLLSEELENGESARDRRMLNKLVTLQRECQHLEGILDAFLQFARVGELRLHPTDLNRAVKEFATFVQAELAEHGIELSPHLAPGLPSVSLDESLMRQVLMNLVRNAQQAMPDGGLLELQTCERDGRVCLDIIDNGLGMDERTRNRMFKAFFSTRTGGSGLGLPTVRKIIEAHNGSIQCDSELGQGTRFSISLPPYDSPIAQDDSEQ
ncbi:MAG: two-component sensor histidine kinase [Planctomycetaceae bacterium]|nr:two-component sensor histidine kinase [Planctomycetaceae bacterium]